MEYGKHELLFNICKKPAAKRSANTCHRLAAFNFRGTLSCQSAGYCRALQITEACDPPPTHIISERWCGRGQGGRALLLLGSAGVFGRGGPTSNRVGEPSSPLLIWGISAENRTKQKFIFHVNHASTWVLRVKIYHKSQNIFFRVINCR